MTQDYRINVPEGQIGEWAVSRFTIEKDTPGALYYTLHGRAIPPGIYTRLTRGGTGRQNVVMSDTPSEIRDHWEILYRLRHLASPTRLLLHGLGLGVVVGAALRSPHVERIDIVEIAPEVIALVGPAYSSDPRVFIHQGDALTYRWPKGLRWNLVWHDIWSDLCMDNLAEMGTLHRRFGRRCDWQGSWGKEWLLTERRQNNR